MISLWIRWNTDQGETKYEEHQGFDYEYRAVEKLIAFVQRAELFPDLVKIVEVPFGMGYDFEHVNGEVLRVHAWGFRLPH